MGGGSLPYTHRGEKLAMLRDPHLQIKQQQKTNRQKINELAAEIHHLNRLIKFQQNQGTESDELIRQVKDRQVELDQQKLNLQSSKDVLSANNPSGKA